MLRIVHPDELGFRIGLITVGISALTLCGLVLIPGRTIAGMPSGISTVITLVKGISLLILLATPFVLPILYWAALKGREPVQALMKPGNAWAHWRYGESEWQDFARSDWDLQRKRALLRGFYVLVFFVGVGIIAPYVSRTPSENPPPFYWFLSFGAISAPIVVITLYWRAKVDHDYRLNNPGEVFIGPDGVIHDGRYTPITAKNEVFGLEVKLTKDPSLRLRFMSGRYADTETLTLPVPLGMEEEATRLVHRFGGEVDLELLDQVKDETLLASLQQQPQNQYQEPTGEHTNRTDQPVLQGSLFKRLNGTVMKWAAGLAVLFVLTYWANRTSQSIESEKHVDPAAIAFEKATNRSGPAMTHSNRGAAFADRHDFDAAIGEYQKALALDPDHILAHHNLGRALWNKGEHQKAIEEIRKAEKIDHNFAPSHVELTLMLFMEKDIPASIAEARIALALQPNNEDALVMLGKGLIVSGDAKSAINPLKSAVRIRPQDAEAHMLLGTALESTQEYDNALKEYLEASRLDPTSKRSRELADQLQSKLKDNKAAAQSK